MDVGYVNCAIAGKMYSSILRTKNRTNPVPLVVGKFHLIIPVQFFQKVVC